MASRPSTDGRGGSPGRLLFVLVWAPVVLVVLTVLWAGMYQLRPFVRAESTCTVHDGLLLAVAAVALGLVAGLGWLIMGSPAWSAVVAAPGYVSVVLLLAFPCSFVPQLVLPPVTVCGLVAAVAVARAYFRGEGGPFSGSGAVGSPR